MTKSVSAARSRPMTLPAGLYMRSNSETFSVFDPQNVSEFERMYNPAGKVIGRERAADTDFVMLGFYIKNNIGISFQVFASGIVFGVGSLFYLVMNGIFMGAVAGYLTHLGYTSTFWSFVCGHGAF